MAAGRECCLYEALNLARAATADDIKNAFRAVAPQLCNERNDSLLSAGRFVQACEAYAELSDGGSAQAAMTIFGDFFGTCDPHEASRSVQLAIEAHTGPKRVEAQPSEQRWLECTLEEIHAGCVKSVPRLTGAPGCAWEAGATACAGADAGRALTLRVPPGAAAGMRFVFPGQAATEPDLPPGNLVYELRELRHPRFDRRGDDLLCTVTVPLHQALTGAVVTVETLDARTLSIPSPGVLAAGAVLRVADEGIAGKGNLLVRIDVRFPEQLSEQQRVLVRAALFLPAELTAEQAAVVKAFSAAFRNSRLGWASRQARHA